MLQDDCNYYNDESDDGDVYNENKVDVHELKTGLHLSNELLGRTEEDVQVIKQVHPPPSYYSDLEVPELTTPMVPIDTNRPTNGEGSGESHNESGK